MTVDGRRPRSLSLLSFLFLGVSLYLWLGALAAVARADIVAPLTLSVPSVYVPIRNAVLAVLFLALAAGLWRQRLWGARLAGVAVPMIAAWGPIERLWLARSEFGAVSLPWTILFSLLWTAMTLALIWRARRFLR